MDPNASQTPVFDIFGPIVESTISMQVIYTSIEIVGNTPTVRTVIAPISSYITKIDPQIQQIKKLYTDAGGVFITSVATLNTLTLKFNIQEGKSYGVKNLIYSRPINYTIAKNVALSLILNPYPMAQALSVRTNHPELTPPFGLKMGEPVWVFNANGESVPGIIAEVKITTDGAVASIKNDLTGQILVGAVTFAVGAGYVIAAKYVSAFLSNWIMGGITPEYYLINLYKVELINGSFVYATDGGERPDLHAIPHIVRRSIPSDFNESLKKVKQVATDPQLPIIMERYKLSLTQEQKDLVDKALVIKLQAAIDAKVKENITASQNSINIHTIPIPIIDNKLLPGPTSVVKKVAQQYPVGIQQNQSSILQGSNQQTIVLVGAGLLFILLIS